MVKKLNWLMVPAMAGLMVFSSTSALAKTTKTPGINSTHWQTAQMVKVVKTTNTQEHAVTLKNQKLTLLSKILKTGSLKKGTTLSVRYLGNQVWQVAGTKYPSSKKGVWLVTNGSTSWFKSIKTTTINSKWSQPHFAELKQAVLATQMQVTTQNKQLQITKTVLKKQTIPAYTKGYVRSLGNGVWQFYNNDYPSNQSGVWLIHKDSAKFFKTVTTTTTNKANANPTYQTVKSAYHTVDSSTAELQNGVYVNVYAPYGYQPLQFSSDFTLTPGSSVRVALDSTNNRYLILNNGKTYAVPNTGNYRFVATNVAKVGTTGNNVESIYAPNDDHAIVENTYQPQNGNLWIQVNGSGQPVQYYFYTTQTNGQTGWAKAVAEVKDGQQVIVPQTN